MTFSCLVPVDAEAMEVPSPREDKEPIRRSLARDEDLHQRGRFTAASGMDEAVEVAANIPVGQYGTIEVRPIMELSTD